MVSPIDEEAIPEMWHHNLHDYEFLSLFILQYLFCPKGKEIRVDWFRAMLYLQRSVAFFGTPVNSPHEQKGNCKILPR